MTNERQSNVGNDKLGHAWSQRNIFVASLESVPEYSGKEKLLSVYLSLVEYHIYLYLSSYLSRANGTLRWMISPHFHTSYSHLILLHYTTILPPH